MSKSNNYLNAKVDNFWNIVKIKYIVDGEYQDRNLVQNSNGRLVNSELQIPAPQSSNAFKNKTHIKTSSMNDQEEKEEDEVAKEVIGPQLNISSEKSTQCDTNIDETLPDTVTVLTTPQGGKLYLVGTAHFSVESQKEVATIIRAVQPHVVALELCQARIDILKFSEDILYNKSANFSIRQMTQVMKAYGPYYGLLQIALYRTTSQIVKELKMAPGGEFRTAFVEAAKVPDCIIHLVDRSISLTIKRTLRGLSWLETIKLMLAVLYLNIKVTKQDAEQYRRRSITDEVTKNMEKHFPTIQRTFIVERDLYLAYYLELATLAIRTVDGSKPVVVGVVGVGHVNGIIANWGKVTNSDISAISEVPPQPLSSKILIYTVKATLYGAVIYVGYKIIPIPLPTIKVFQSLRWSITNVLKATAYIDEYEHTVPGVMYVVQNIPGPGIDIEEFESEYILGCMCTDQCFDCSCTRGSPNYTNGLLLDAKLSGPIIECNSHCTCRENCGNRVIQKGPLNSLIVSETNQKGLGLFTTKSIRRGQFICEYAGEVIGIEEARRRVEENKYSMNYVLVVSEHISDRVIVTCIDPKYFGNIGRYSNHSCEPNADLVPIRVEGTVPRLCLFASRDIQIGEEITFNYAGEGANSIHIPSDTPCLCGSNNCSGYLPHNSI